MQNPEKSQKTIGVLSSIAIFENLNPSIKQSLNQVAILKNFANGQVVCFEGDPCEGAYIVKEGWLKSVKIAANGREQIIRFFGPGELFNIVGVLTENMNQTTVEVLEPAKVWFLQSVLLTQMMDKYPSFGRIITQNLAEHVQHLMNLVENLSLLNVEARLARIFLEHSSSNVLNRRRWSTQTEMASRLGTVPDVLNRTLRSLAEEGLIKIERHQIHILDRPGLQRKAMLGE